LCHHTIMVWTGMNGHKKAAAAAAFSGGTQQSE